MKSHCVFFLRITVLICSVAVYLAFDAAPACAATSNGCAPTEPLSAPRVVISNGAVNAVVLLPDAKNGYYRGSRFDWSGVVGCLTYRGHNYFGVWFPKYDPTRHDSITGPVEEFLAADAKSAPGYDEARPGELFVKPGVGALRRLDESAYSFATPYPLVDGGRWTVHAKRNQVTFRQDMISQVGVSYVYRKKLKLESKVPVLIIEHALTNRGPETIDMQVYNHDFFMLDGAPTGPGMTIRFSFTPRTDKPLEDGARIVGNQIVYDRELENGESAFAEITGYGDRSSDFDFVVQDTRSGIGVEESGDLPLSHVFFWSIRKAICPEGFVHIKVLPGQTARWTIRYRFYAN
jgi:hypothetical protein